MKSSKSWNDYELARKIIRRPDMEGMRSNLSYSEWQLSSKYDWIKDNKPERVVESANKRMPLD